MMRGAMEMEYVIKLIIMLVVVAAVIMLVWTFYDDTRMWWCKTMGACGDETGDGKTEVVKQQVFRAADVAKFVDSCWMMTGEDHSGNFVCYVLQGSFEVEPDSIAPLLKAFNGSRLDVQADFRGGSAVIQFVDLENKIVIS